MSREQPVAILDPLRRLITRQTGSALSDAQLLENFVSRRDEASFEVLVWRHGAMVLALCKRILRDSHEAEDAFQATFMVFARKAASIGRGEVLAAWLYKVAYRIAIRARAAAAKRSNSSEPTEAIPAPQADSDTDWTDLKPVLDDEIARLPEKYRAPFVLCYLEGRTNEEAAAQLGCPKGTVLSRLSRGRERLRARLARRGVALTATAFALALSHNAASAFVPAALVPSAINAAVPFAAGAAAAELVPAHVAALTEGALHTMTLFKLKLAASALLALAVLGSGLAWAARDAGTSAPATTAAFPAPAAESNPDAALEQDRQRERPGAPALTGRVSDVAKDGKSFTVETPPTERGGAPGKTTVKLTEKAAITYHGVGLNGATPTTGYGANVWFAENSKDTAATVVFHGAEGSRRTGDIAGQVVEVAKDGKSITIQPRSARPERGVEPKKQTIPFDAKTVLVFSNVGKDQAKPTAGYSAMVWLADDSKTAAKVQFINLTNGGRRDENRPNVIGKVMRAADGKAIVLETQPQARGEEPTRVTITLTDKTTAIYNNVPLGGAKPAPGMQAHVWLAESSKDTAAKVVYIGTVPERGTTVSGKVIAVAKDGKSFTIEAPPTMRGQDGKRTELKVAAQTKFAFFGVGPGEAKLAEGLMAQVQLAEGSTDTAAHATLNKAGARTPR